MLFAAGFAGNLKLCFVVQTMQIVNVVAVAACSRSQSSFQSQEANGRQMGELTAILYDILHASPVITVR